MAFRLKPRETIAHGLRRLVTGELKSARSALRQGSPPPDTAVFAARKSLKKVRAVRDLIAADAGAHLRGSRKTLRRVNRRLSTLRDADALLDILKKLRRSNPRLFDEHTFARVRRRLADHKRASMAATDDARAWDSIDRDLRVLRRNARRWRPRHQGFRALGEGIRVTLRKGRQALERAQHEQRADAFHAWRKHVKALWYDLRLIEDCSPDVSRDVSALQRAQAELGDDHNLEVLCEELAKHRALCDLERLRHAVNRYQRALRRKAMTHTAHIYSPLPDEYVRTVRRAWKDWQRGHKTARAARSRTKVA
jgi:CHAD domain